jgi:divalent metal cation (Fe/Co/Zn/Cd) transporter
MIISLISMAFMGALVLGKRKVGYALKSELILEDAKCSMVCLYMSGVLLASSVIYQSTGFSLADSLGAAGLIYFSINEGREAFEKSRSGSNTRMTITCLVQTI